MLLVVCVKLTTALKPSCSITWLCLLDAPAISSTGVLYSYNCDFITLTLYFLIIN